MRHGHATLMAERPSDGGRPVRRALRRIRITVGAVIVRFGRVGVVAGPLLLRHVLTGPLAAAWDRPVHVGGIGVNPYTLKVDLDRLQIGERGTSPPCLAIGHRRLRVSWVSLVRWALVVKELRMERPALPRVRTADQRFHVSDLLDGARRLEKPRTPFRGAVATLQLHDGPVDFDDQVRGGRHTLAQVQLGVPCLSNLPRPTAKRSAQEGEPPIHSVRAFIQASGSRMVEDRT
jgi:hypothetical protein